MCYNFILQVLFQSAQHLYDYKKGSGSEADPDPGGSNSCGSGSPTLRNIETGNAVLHRGWVILSYFVRETSTGTDAVKSDVLNSVY